VAGTRALDGDYGPVNITFGGLFDGGQVVPKSDVPAEFQSLCNPNPNATTCFIPVPDGNLDPGYYYVQGGSFRLDAVSAIAGVRFTF
jgi:hypothetical protein